MFSSLKPKDKHRFDQEKEAENVVAWEYHLPKVQLGQLIRKGMNTKLDQVGVIKNSLNILEGGG